MKATACVTAAAITLVLAMTAGRPEAQGAAPAGFVSLFNGKDLAGWKIPAGDGGHWKVVDGVIDYDAESQSEGDKCLWSEREFVDFVLLIDWRIKATPYVNGAMQYVLPDGTTARDVKGKDLR